MPNLPFREGGGGKCVEVTSFSSNAIDSELLAGHASKASFAHSQTPAAELIQSQETQMGGTWGDLA
jgi:hypothetical protein